MRQAVKQTTNYSQRLLFEPAQGFETPNMMEFSEGSNIKKKINERISIENRETKENRNHLSFVIEKRRLKKAKKRKKAEKSKSKKEEKSKKKTQDKKKNVKNTAAKPKKPKKRRECSRK